jgi:hypothetical protein
MSECEEIAQAMLPAAPPLRDECDARVFVRRLMPRESLVVVDNVAEALWRFYEAAHGPATRPLLTIAALALIGAPWLPGCASLPPETRREETAYQVLAAIDASESLRIATHARTYGENNPLLGNRPTPRRVALVFTLGAAAHLGVTELLIRQGAPPWALRTWEAAGITLEAAAIGDNAAHGITPTLSFTVHP